MPVQCTFGAAACAGPLASTHSVSLQLVIKPQSNAGGRGDLILQETRLCVLSTLHTPHPAPPNPTAHSLPGCNDTFQQDEVSPVGLQPNPSGIWGKPLTLPGTLAMDTTRAAAGGCGPHPLMPVASVLFCSSWQEPAQSQGQVFVPFPKGDSSSKTPSHTAPLPKVAPSQPDLVCCTQFLTQK